MHENTHPPKFRFLLVDANIYEEKRADKPQFTRGLSALRLLRLALNYSYLLVLYMNNGFLLTLRTKQGIILQGGNRINLCPCLILTYWASQQFFTSDRYPSNEDIILP